MTVLLREALSSKRRISLAALRSSLLLFLLSLFATSAFAQGLSPGNPVSFGPVDLGQTVTQDLTFSTTPGGANIASVAVVTQGVAGKDFTLVSATGCIGQLPYPGQCSVTVAFNPLQIGIRLGALIITNTGGTINTLVNLSGIGVGPQFVFQPATFSVLNTATGLTPATFSPSASVQDPNGNTFFTDVANNRILEKSSTNVFSVVYTGTGGFVLSNTSTLVIDGSGILYISAGVNVYTLAPGATTVNTLYTGTVILNHPTGLVLDTAGDLYIADSYNNNIFRVVLSTGFSQALPLTAPAVSPSTRTTTSM